MKDKPNSPIIIKYTKQSAIILSIMFGSSLIIVLTIIGLYNLFHNKTEINTEAVINTSPTPTSTIYPPDITSTPLPQTENRGEKKYLPPYEIKMIKTETDLTTGLIIFDDTGKTVAILNFEKGAYLDVPMKIFYTDNYLVFHLNGRTLDCGDDSWGDPEVEEYCTNLINKVTQNDIEFGGIWVYDIEGDYFNKIHHSDKDNYSYSNLQIIRYSENLYFEYNKNAYLYNLNSNKLIEMKNADEIDIN